MSAEDLLPTGAAISDAALRDEFTVRQVGPTANPDFAFEVRVPRRWERLEMPGTDRAVSAERLTPLSGWDDPAQRIGPMMFHVQAIGLPRELSAEHLLMLHALEARAELIAIRAPSATLSNGLMRLMIEGAPFLLRVAVFMDGDRAFFVTGMAPAEEYPDYADTFAAMMSTFRVTRPSPRRTVEPHVRRTLLDAIAFEAPASFKALDAPGATETHRAMDLFHRDPRGAFTGVIRVELDLGVAAPSADDDLAAVRRELERRGLEIEAVKSREMDEGEGALVGRGFHVLHAKDAQGIPHEIPVSLLAVHGRPLRIWSLSRGRRFDFPSWAIHDRAFRVINDTLSIL
ncbi:MAG: hypothetical protein VYE22_31300 [Myxococcota bacterium]|nr:hypothetical protein [Myxococcota bacterium]